MSMFEYKGVLASGELTRGERKARSPEELRSVLAQEGVVVAEVHPAKGQGSLTTFATLRSNRSLVGFTRQMAVMLRSSMRLDSILRVLLRQSNSAAWRSILQKLAAKLNDGRSLSEALASQPAVFDRYYVSVVQAGETSGELSEVFRRLAKSIESADHLKRKVRAALAYPAVIMAIAVIVLLTLLIYIVPVFKEMFLNFQTEMPPLTKFVIGLSDGLTQHPWSAFLVVLVGSLSLYFLNENKWFGSMVSQLVLRIPGLGGLVIKSETVTFSRTMATLLWGGVALNEAIPLAAAGVKNSRLRSEFENASSAISSGSTLYQAWTNKKYVPPMVSEMVSVGEETGQLAGVFDTIGDFYSEEVETTLPAITAIVEPILIVVVGIFVAAILLSMYLPLFELIGQFG